MHFLYLLALGFFPSHSPANPYYDPTQVPLDSAYHLPALRPLPPHATVIRGRVLGSPVLRATLSVSAGEVYSLANLVREFSGTPALVKRTRHASRRGSYRAQLKDAATGKPIAFDDIGLGKEFRRLVDGITFRFPMPSADVELELLAENPLTGKMEKVFSRLIRPGAVPTLEGIPPGLEIREIGRPTSEKSELRVNIYAEGYLAGRRNDFWPMARKAMTALVANNFPLADRMHFYAVFADSAEPLGPAKDLGHPVPEKNSFLSLAFPYWENFGRWYNVVYPTRETRYRDGLASAPYDYAITVADDSAYWGVGNYRELVAVPAKNNAFVYLLLHEIGHYFGLNEEYEGGGPTELEFAPGIEEPWSPNITFRASGTRADLKWGNHVAPAVPLPTPASFWNSHPPSYGAYPGGYGDSDPHRSHKPGHACVMERGKDFCDICAEALTGILRFDAGD
jgi:hypothetical protein